MKDVISALNDILYLTIENISFDMAKKEITMHLLLIDNGSSTSHELKFVDCASFMWIEKMDSSSLFDFRECNYYELTAVEIEEISVASEHKWLKQYSIEYNIAVEIWESALLINAQGLCVDREWFQIRKTDY